MIIIFVGNYISKVKTLQNTLEYIIKVKRIYIQLQLFNKKIKQRTNYCLVDQLFSGRIVVMNELSLDDISADELS